MDKKKISDFELEVLRNYASTLQLFVWGVSETELFNSVVKFERLNEYEECEGINRALSFIKDNTKVNVHTELMSVMKKIIKVTC